MSEFAVREEVMKFAQLMENKLAKNDYKKGWENDSVIELMQSLFDEFVELYLAVRQYQSFEEIGAKAVDIANFAMMIADKCKILDSSGK